MPPRSSKKTGAVAAPVPAPQTMPEAAPISTDGLGAAPKLRVKLGSQLRKKDFLDRATERAGIRKPDARTAIEAALAVLAEALVEGHEIVLPPIGKIRVTKTRDNGRALIMTLRITRAHDAGDRPAAAQEGLAEDGDTG